MRYLLMTLLALAAFAREAPVEAQGADYPWCIVYSGTQADGGEHCMFVSYAQCLRTAFPGAGATCVPNLRLGPPGRGR